MIRPACFVLILLLTAMLNCAAAASIELFDGTVIRGDIISLENGRYTVKNPSLGRIQVKQTDVSVIRFTDSKAEGASTTGAADQSPSQGPAQIRQIQLGLAADSNIMGMITSLQSDPQIQSILADPEIMKAVSRGDLATLMANPKFMAILNNPGIRDITDKTQPAR